MSQATDPLITVLLPTRERAYTLGFTLQTVLSQPGADVQVVVSDNASQDDTRQVIESLADPRILYVNTGRRLSICDSWEFALSHATGRYITAIGDDDALMPGAIARFRQLISTDPRPIYHWDAHSYRWPGADAPANIDQISGRTDPHEMDLVAMARWSLAWGGFRYRRLPLLYHGLVERALLDRLREQTGRVFHSTQQDVCLAFVLPAICPWALHVGEALTAYGQSTPAVKPKAAQDEKSDYGQWVQRFLREVGDYRIHPTLYPEAPLWLNLVPDAMVVAVDLFPDVYGKGAFNYSAMWAWLQDSSSWESPAWVLRRAAEIRKYHPFSIREFAFHTTFHRLLKVRRGMRAQLARSRARAAKTPCPDNIVDFVNLVSQAD